MKSLGFLGAAVAALIVAGCSSSSTGSDGMMSGKDGAACSLKAESGCPIEAAAKAKKDGCCASEAAVKVARKDGCCASEAKATEVKKYGCCSEKSEVKAAKKDGGCEAGTTKLASGCCKGKEISAACSDCKKACEAAGGCDTGKKCDASTCEETKP